MKKTLFGEGGVQGLDGEAHRHRKALFMSLMTEDALREIRVLARKHWQTAAAEWEAREEIVLYDEAKKLLTRFACEWTGVPLEESEIDERAELLSEMFERPADVSLGHFKGWRARSKTEDWIEGPVREVREQKREIDRNRALYTFSMHEDLEGNRLAATTVAVELLNLLRPIVAICVYIAFLALAVHQYAEKAQTLRKGDPKDLERFVQEVRRYCPFFPFAAAKVKADFTWNGYDFEKDTLTLLDLYGTNHHPEDWEDSDRFEPERFAHWDESPFNLIPQGGGTFDRGHRCAGEWITIEVMKESLDYLVNSLSYSLPEQDLSFSMTDIPARPKSRIVMKNVRRTEG